MGCPTTWNRSDLSGLSNGVVPSGPTGVVPGTSGALLEDLFGLVGLLDRLDMEGLICTGRLVHLVPYGPKLLVVQLLRRQLCLPARCISLVCHESVTTGVAFFMPILS